jgi:hypothetical protein
VRCDWSLIFKNPAALAPDLAGALLSIAGLGLVLWSLIEAPVRGWSSPLVIGAGVGGLAVLAAYAAGPTAVLTGWRQDRTTVSGHTA